MIKDISPQEFRKAAQAAATLGDQFKALLLVTEVLGDLESLDRRYQDLMAKRKASSRFMEAELRDMEDQHKTMAAKLASVVAQYDEKNAELNRSFIAQRTKQQAELQDAATSAKAKAAVWQKEAANAKAEVDSFNARREQGTAEWEAEVSAWDTKVSTLKVEFAALKERLG